MSYLPPVLVELLTLVGVLAGLGLFIVAVRRASARQITTRKSAQLETADKPASEDAPRTAPAPEREALEPHRADDAGQARADETLALRAGLTKTRGGFVAKLGRIFSKKAIDEHTLDELESVLFTADIGPRTAERLFGRVKTSMKKDELADPAQVWAEIRNETQRILEVDAPPLDFTGPRPFVLLTIGVNGVGKTTTIGKIAAKLQGEGKTVLLAAGDTFRAAAVEQLQIWGQRAGAEVVSGKPESDPSAVVFDAIRKGIECGADVVIADTAGRLHTKVDLMEELRKIGRVCEKALPGCPHETLLVLDATNGQNAIQQAKLFGEAMAVSGIALTKLDGTAKGGVILGICDELKVPVRYVGIGEKVEDLREFDVPTFVEALYGEPDSDFPVSPP